VIAVWLILTFAFTAFARVSLAIAVQDGVRNGLLVDAVAIVGDGAQAERLARQLKQTKPFTPELLGIFADVWARHAVVENEHNANVTKGTIEELVELGKLRRIDWIFLTAPYTEQEKLTAVVVRLKALAVPVAVCPHIELNSPYRTIDYIGDAVPVTVVQSPENRAHLHLQRVAQFVPRWMTTLLTLLAVGGNELWSQARAARLARAAAAQPGEIVECEVDNYTADGFLEVATHFDPQRFGYVVTPNIDHIIRLHEDPAFRNVYHAAQYVLLDSRFLCRLLRLIGRQPPPVCTGADLTEKLLSSISGASERIVIIGGDERRVRALAQRFRLIDVAHYNPPMNFIRDEAAIAKCVEFIESQSPFRYCFLALGSPQQEFLAHRLQVRGTARGLALCVGAAIDFLTGVERRAPKWMQQAGLEWSYRLVQKPRRLAQRYLLRDPQIFWLLGKTTFVLRRERSQFSNIDVPPAEAA